jgi:hypothetical protein
MNAKKVSQKAAYWLGVMAIGLMIGLTVKMAQAWVGPPTSPPGGNVGAPINTSAAAQIKSGNFTTLGRLQTSGGGAYGFGALNFGYHSLNSHSNGWLYLGDQNNAIYGGRGLAADNLWASNTLYANNTLCLKGDCRTAWPASAASQWITNGSNIYYNSGNVGVGTTAPTYRLDVNGTIRASEAFIYSDRNLKDNIQIIPGALEKVLQLEGVKFQWKETGKEDIGVVAQDVEEIFPELVSTDANGVKSVKYGNLAAPLIEAIKEQQKQISDQQKQIDELKAEIEGLRK